MEELSRLGLPTETPWTQDIGVEGELSTGRFRSSTLLAAKIAAGVVALILLILVTKMVGSLMPKTLYGSLEWRIGSTSGKRDIAGTSLKLASLGIPGWSPKKSYLLRNIDGEVTLTVPGEPPRPLKKHQSFSLDGATFVFRSQF